MIVVVISDELETKISAGWGPFFSKRAYIAERRERTIRSGADGDGDPDGDYWRQGTPSPSESFSSISTLISGCCNT